MPGTHFIYHDPAAPNVQRMRPSQPMSFLVPPAQPASAAPRLHPSPSYTHIHPLPAPHFSPPAPQPIPSPHTPDPNPTVSLLLSSLKAHECALKTTIESLATHTKDVSKEREDSDTRDKRALAFFEKVFAAQQDHQRTIRTIETKVTALQTDVTALKIEIGSLNKSDQTVIERFDSLTYAIEDLLEREKDPEALRR